LNRILECGKTIHGFVDHSLRRKAWPIILNMKDSQSHADNKPQQEPSSEILKKCNEGKSTAKKDANRSFSKLKELDPKARLMLLIRIALNFN